MAHQQRASGSTLLDYAVTTDPSPLQVTPRGQGPTRGAIIIAVSNGGDAAVYCNEISFTIPVGVLAQDLTNNTGSILYSAAPSNQWSISMPSPGQFVATPKIPDDNKITTQGLVFQLYHIDVNEEVGTFNLDIGEVSSPLGSDFKHHKANIKIAKFPYGFFVRNFHANMPSIANGGKVTLSWIGSELAGYDILDGESSIDVSDQRSWMSPALHSTTTFMLKATAQEKGETVNTYESVTVIVTMPDIAANSLSVAGISNLKGATNVGTSSAPSDLTVEGAAGVSGDTTIGGATSLAGALGVAGATNLKEAATLDKTLAVTGVTTLQTANAQNLAAGVASISTVLALTGVSQMFGPVKTYTQVGSYTAPTDGFVIGQVNSAGIDPVSLCMGWAYGYSGGLSVSAFGGNVLGYSGWSNYYANCPASFTLPVKKGNSWGISTGVYDKNDHNPSFVFYWVPLGTDAAKSEPEFLPHAKNEAEVAYRCEGIEVVNPVGERIDR